jgi:hypothetical protein
MKLFAAKFASAPGTDPGVYLEGLLAIGLLPQFSFSPRLGDYPILPVFV